jgi:hypothetical protein
VEVVAQVRNELGVCRMIGRFNADDPRIEGPVMLLHVSQKVKLRLRRAHKQDLTAALQGPGDLTEESWLVVGMVPDAQVLFVGMAVNVRSRRGHNRSVDLSGVNLEEARLFLIDPHDSVLHDDLSGRRLGDLARPAPRGRTAENKPSWRV